MLKKRAERIGVADRISTLAYTMDKLLFADEELGIIWSEGAIVAAEQREVELFEIYKDYVNYGMDVAKKLG